MKYRMALLIMPAGDGHVEVLVDGLASRGRPQNGQRVRLRVEHPLVQRYQVVVAVGVA